MSDFGDLLKNIRISAKIEQEDLGRGICSGSEISRIESGEREAGFMLQTALLSRLGFFGGSYCNYIYKDEYDRLIERREIIDKIEDDHFEDAVLLIDKYISERIKSSNPNMVISLNIERQFCEAMWIQLLRKQGAQETEILHHCVRAVEFSMSHLLKGSLTKTDLLTFQEFDILLEYTHSREMTSDTSDDHSAVYKELYEWILDQTTDSLVKAIFVPKIALYFSRYLGKTGYLNENATLLAQMEIRAVEILRECQKCFFIDELNKEIQNLNLQMDGIFDTSIDIRLLQDTCDSLNRIYKKHGQKISRSSSLFLYYERRVFFIGDVINSRRKTLQMTNMELCEGICDIRVLNGLISGKKKTQPSIVKALLKRVYLIPELSSFEILSKDRDALKEYFSIPSLINNGMYEECWCLMESIKRYPAPGVLQNTQIIMYYEATLLYFERKISEMEYVDKLRETLSLTIQMNKAKKMKEVFLSTCELSCVKKIVEHTVEDCSELKAILWKIFGYIEATHEEKAHLGSYLFVADYVYKKYYEENKHYDALELARRLISLSLDSGNLSGLYKAVYNEYRANYAMEQNPYSRDERKECIKDLLLLSQFCRANKAHGFFESVYESENY